MVGGRVTTRVSSTAPQAPTANGSSFKPFRLSRRLEDGLRPDDHFVDATHPQSATGSAQVLRPLQGVHDLGEGLAQRSIRSRLRCTGAGVPNVTSPSPTDLDHNPAGPRRQHRATAPTRGNIEELVSAYAPFGQCAAMAVPAMASRDKRTACRWSTANRSGTGRVIAHGIVGMMMKPMLAGVRGSDMAPGIGRRTHRPEVAARPARPGLPRRWFAVHPPLWFERCLVRQKRRQSPMKQGHMRLLPAALARIHDGGQQRRFPARPFRAHLPPESTPIVRIGLENLLGRSGWGSGRGAGRFRTPPLPPAPGLRGSYWRPGPEPGPAPRWSIRAYGWRYPGRRTKCTR